VAALARNVFDSPEEPAPGALRLAAYIRLAAGRLAEQGAQALGRAEITFPNPEGLAATAETPSQDVVR
jgi:hypothetical protein